MRRVLPIAIFIFGLTALFGNVTAAQGQLYTLEDLQVLETNRDYREFLDHATDVRPSERREPWPQMVRNMATGYIDFLIKRKDYSQESFNYIEGLTSWPTLRQDEFFHIRWQRYGIRSIRHCLSESEANDSDQCKGRLQRLWHSTTPNPEFGLQVAELMRQLDPKSNLWEYYQHSAQSPIVAEYHCSRAELKRWAFRTLHEKIQRNDLHGKQLKKEIESQLHIHCWEHLEADLKRILHGPRPQQISAYLLLDAMDALEREQEDLFLVRYFLEGPEVGRLFNLSWARIEQLSRDRQRRESVLRKLTSLDPLPGAIFATTHGERREVLLNHLSQNFPEYLDSYGRTCLDYREGLRHFPRGNPTIECRELFQAQEQSDSRWVDQGLRLRYSAQER